LLTLPLILLCCGRVYNKLDARNILLQARSDVMLPRRGEEARVCCEAAVKGTRRCPAHRFARSLDIIVFWQLGSLRRLRDGRDPIGAVLVDDGLARIIELIVADTAQET
jgi:hypothetical protein